MASAAVMAGVSLGSTVLSGVMGAKKAQTNAEAQRLSVQSQMLQTIGQAFGFEAAAQQSQYTANINKYQAGVAELNKEISKANAIYARDVGEVEAQQAGMKAHAEMGEMIASQGASGLEVSSGSSTKVRESMIEIGDYTQRVIRASAAKKAYGYDVEAMQYGAQADVYRYTAQQNEAQRDNALTAAEITRRALPMEQQAMGLVGKSESLNIMGSLVGTAGTVASRWSEGAFKGLTG